MRRLILARSIASLAVALALPSTASAQTSGTWNVDAGGTWGNAANWAGGVVPDGADGTANFRFNITATRTVTLDTPRTIGSLVFEDLTTVSNDWALNASGGSALTLDATAGPGSITILNRTATINAVLAGNDGINVSAATTGTVGGTVVLNAANTFTGGLTVTGGTVQLNNANAAGGVANTITLAPSANTGVANKVTIAGGVVLPNNFILEGGAAPVAGNGLIQQVGTGQATVNGSITINGSPANGGHFVGGGTLGNELVINGPITSGVQVVQRVGRVLYKSSDTSSYSSLGVTGTALLGTTNGILPTATVTLAVSEVATLDLNGFDQTLAGLQLGQQAFNTTTALGARTLTMTGGITTQSNGFHRITGTGSLSFGSLPGVFTVNEGTAPVDLQIAPKITGNEGFSKDGSGTMVVNGAVTNTGPIFVNSGRLDLNGTVAAPQVTVQDFAGIGGETTLTNLALGAGFGGSLFVDASTSNALTAGTVAFSGTTTVNVTQAPTVPGPIRVLNYTTKTGTSDFALADVFNYRAASFTEAAGAVNLNVTTKAITWTGATNGTWDVNGTTNWKDGATPENFFYGDTVTFDDTSAVTNIAVTSGVSPWKTEVNAALNNYTLTSTGTGISGPGSLVKSGASTLALVGANSFAGPAVVTGGAVSITNVNSLGNGSPTNTLNFDGGRLNVTITAATNLGDNRRVIVGPAGGTIVATTGNTTAQSFTIGGGLSGTGTLTLSSGATALPTVYVVGGDGSGFSGNVTVDSNGATAGATTLRLTSSSAITNGTITLLNPTTSATGAATGLDLQGVTLPSGVALSLNSNLSGTISQRTQLTNTAGVAVINGPLELNGNNIIQFTSNVSTTLNGNTTAGSGGFTGIMFLRGSGQGVVNGTINIPNGALSKTDAATWTINSTGNQWATTNIFNAGSIRLGATNALPITAPLTIGQGSDNSNSLLDLNGFNQEVPSIAYVAGTGNSTRGIGNTSTTLATLTVNNANNIAYGASTGVTGGILLGNLRLVKTGAGTLTLQGASTFTGPIVVEAGTLVAGGATTTSLGSATTAGRTITVNNGSTLSFATNNVFGNGVNNNNLPSITLNNSTATATRYNVLGNVTLNASTLTQASTDSANFEGFQFRGSVTAGGAAASTISSDSGKANHLGPNTVFDVADATGSGVTDLLVSAAFRDQSGDFGSGPGGLTKTGAGTLELAATTNSYTGSTTVNAGTLLVTGAVTGAIAVNAGGTLSGMGAVGGVTLSGGALAPGVGVGTLTTGALSLDSASMLKFELAQAGVVGGGTNDLLSVSGNFTLDGTLQISALPGFGDGTYRLANYTGSLTDAGLNLDAAFLAVRPGSTIDVATPGQVNLVVVPEPSALTSLLGGVALLLGLGRARRQAIR